jgi:hypothetical protein
MEKVRYFWTLVNFRLQRTFDKDHRSIDATLAMNIQCEDRTFNDGYM